LAFPVRYNDKKTLLFPTISSLFFYFFNSFFLRTTKGDGKEAKDEEIGEDSNSRKKNREETSMGASSGETDGKKYG
jgi:hypothetical protein